MAFSREKLAKFKQVLQIDGDRYPEPTGELIAKARRRIPPILYRVDDLTPALVHVPGSTGAFYADDVALVLVEEGHGIATAHWAIYQMITEGVLTADVVPKRCSADILLEASNLERVMEIYVGRIGNESTLAISLSPAFREEWLRRHFETTDKASGDPGEQHDHSGRRPAYSRDQTMLDWYEARDTSTYHSPTAILECWNYLSESKRKALAPKCCGRVSWGQKGIEVIKKALVKARRERANTAKAKPGEGRRRKHLQSRKQNQKK